MPSRPSAIALPRRRTLGRLVVLHPPPGVVGKAAAKMQNLDDFCAEIEIVPGETRLPRPGMFGGHFGAYT